MNAMCKTLLLRLVRWIEVLEAIRKDRKKSSAKSASGLTSPRIRERASLSTKTASLDLISAQICKTWLIDYTQCILLYHFAQRHITTTGLQAFILTSLNCWTTHRRSRKRFSFLIALTLTMLACWLGRKALIRKSLRMKQAANFWFAEGKCSCLIW